VSFLAEGQQQQLKKHISQEHILKNKEKEFIREASGRELSTLLSLVYASASRRYPNFCSRQNYDEQNALEKGGKRKWAKKGVFM
jgi:phage terminase Nu1 subunit (DNA packaging protein)